MLSLWKVFVSILIIATLIPSTVAQDYAEYVRGNRGARRRNNRGLVLAASTGLLGGLIGGVIATQRANKKFQKERENFRRSLQQAEDYTLKREKLWQQEYQKLYRAYEELEKESVERDYEEFKAPDTDNDDMISKAEFNTYVKKYLSSFPELSEKDFPKFEDFDHDHDGLVSFEEWQQFLLQQKAQEAAKKGTAKNENYQELLDALYEQASRSDNFNTLQKNAGGSSKGKQANNRIR